MGSGEHLTVSTPMYTTDHVPGDQRMVKPQGIRAGQPGTSHQIALRNLGAAVEDLHPDAVVGVGFTAIRAEVGHGRSVTSEVEYIAYGTCVRYESGD